MISRIRAIDETVPEIMLRKASARTPIRFTSSPDKHSLTALVINARVCSL